MFTKHRGELYLILGALFFSFNGVIATVVLTHMSAFRLAQIRALSAFLILFTFLFIRHRALLKFQWREVPKLALYGSVGFALVNFGYFLGIERSVPLGLVLILEFTAPIWIALWIKYVRRGFVAREMWLGIALSLVGLVFVAEVWDGFTFDFLGIAASIGSAFALTVYFLMGEKLTKERPPIATTVFGLFFAGLFWLIVLPIWNFPTEVFTTSMNLQGVMDSYSAPGWALILYIIIFGTIIPYLFVISGLRLLAASKSSVLGMLEPVLAGIFAWIWLGQSWNLIQLLGALVVLVGIYIADTAKSVVTN